MKNRKIAFELICLISVFTLLPFIGLTEFNTKGEPREAIVAYSMLAHHNWILPVNNGGDIAYKPPFFHWCIATFSLINQQVTEFTSRLPSSLALIGMVIGGFIFYAKRKNTQVAVLGSLLTLTAFEVHRAGINCRVDMVLTAMIVAALYLLYRWWEKGQRAMPWGAILCMSLATLTKGPVGIILPCLVTGVFLLLIGGAFWKIFGKMFLFAVLACLLPACWYLAAYHEGGKAFLNLALEENFGRFLGKMTYESHEEPVYYNFITVIAGWLPWTLLMLLSLFSLPWKKLYKQKSASPFIKTMKHWWLSVRQMEPVKLFTWLCIVLIFVFYCIPKSKRSVYLLPIYPFIAMLMAEYIIYLCKINSRAIKIYAGFIATLCILITCLFGCIKAGWIPDSIFHGKHAIENIRILHGLETISFPRILLALFPLIAGIFTWIKIKDTNRATNNTMGCILLLYLALDGAYQPAVLNTKSDKPLADYIQRNLPIDKIYSYMSIDMLRFYMVNFYLGDKVQLFEKAKPTNGILMIPDHDREQFFEHYKMSYHFTPVSQTTRRMSEMKQIIYFYHFEKI